MAWFKLIPLFLGPKALLIAHWLSPSYWSRTATNAHTSNGSGCNFSDKIPVQYLIILIALPARNIKITMKNNVFQRIDMPFKFSILCSDDKKNINWTVEAPAEVGSSKVVTWKTESIDGCFMLFVSTCNVRTCFSYDWSNACCEDGVSLNHSGKKTKKQWYTRVLCISLHPLCIIPNLCYFYCMQDFVRSERFEKNYGRKKCFFFCNIIHSYLSPTTWTYQKILFQHPIVLYVTVLCYGK